MGKGYLKLLSVLWPLALFVTSTAQDPDSVEAADAVLQLEEVTVISSRLRVPANQLGQPVRIILREELEASNLYSLDEVLRYEGLAEVQSRGAGGVQSDILLRGSSFNQVLILIDGMRINDPLTGHFNAYLPVTEAEIQKIEIFRGPAATIHGPDAVGGVINIITRSFQKEAESRQLDGKLSLLAGENKLIGTNSGFFLNTGKIALATGIRMNRSDGHEIADSRSRGDFNLKTFSLSVSPRLNEKLTAAFRIGYDNRLFNAANFYTVSPLDQSREQVRTSWNQFQLNYRINSRHVTQWQAVYKSLRDSFLFSPDFQANIHDTKMINGQLNHHFKAGKNLRLSAGLQLDHRQIESTDRGDHRHLHAGLHFLGFMNIGSELYISSGFRLDHENNYGWKLLPQLGCSYSTGQVRVRTAAGRTNRVPDFTERYVSTGLSGPLSAGRNLGNPSLADELSWNAEIGLDHDPFHFFKWSATIFTRLSDNLIDYVLTGSENIPWAGNLEPGAEYFYAMNLAHLKTSGLELEGSFDHTFRDVLETGAGIAYAFLDTRSDEELVSKYLANHSRHLLNGRLSLRWHSLNLRLHCLMKSRKGESAEAINSRLEPAYSVWNIKLDKYFLNEKIITTFQVNNLFDRTYTDILGASLPGRWISGGLTFRFSRSANPL